MRIGRWLPDLIVVAALTGMIACGGGGSGAGSGGPGGSGGTRQPSPDTVPQSIASTSPPGGYAAVDRDAAIRVEFREPMTGGSFDPSSFGIKDALGNPVPGSVAYADNAAVFTPASPLAPGARYTATLSQGILDANGVPLAGMPYSWEFTVRADMGPPFLVANFQSGHGLNAASGENGDLFVVWYDRDLAEPSREGVFVSRKPVTGNWETPVQVGRLVTPVAWENIPGVVVDRAGNALVVWNDGQGTGNGGYARYSPATGWGAQGNFAGCGAELKLAGNRDGKAVVTYVRGNFEAVCANTYAPDTGWSAPFVLSAGGTVPCRAQASVDPAGNVVAVWQESTPAGNNHVWARRHVPATGWGSPVKLDHNTLFGYLLDNAWVESYSSGMPQVGTDDAGNAVCVWSQSWTDHATATTTAQNLWTARFDVESGWSAPASIHPDPTFLARYPGISVGPSGSAIATLSGLAVDYDSATGWGGGVAYPAATMGDYPAPIATDLLGRAITVWSQRDGDLNRLWMARYAPGSGWSAPVAAGLDEAAGTSFPRLAMDRYGRSSVVWSQGGKVWSRTLQ